MEMAEEHVQWRPDEEEDVLEVADEGLRGRRPRLPAAAVSGCAGESDETLNSSKPVNSNAFHEQESTLEEPQNGKRELDSSNMKVNEEETSENNVYYDKDEGIWKCRNCCWTHQNGSPWIDYMQHPKWHLHMLMNVKTINQQGECFFCETEGTELKNGLSVTENSGIQVPTSERSPGNDGLIVTIKNFECQNGQNSVINHQYKEKLNDDSYSGFGLLACETPLEEQQKYKPVSDAITQLDDIEPIKESDKEFSEFDVERVLEKQNTHDLYCPNCNSCITRRVILRKRKRRIKIPGEDIKHNKLETVSSESGAISTNATGSLDHRAAGDSSDTPAANDSNLDREPDIFRCLSCFSLFIPMGSGFKVIKIFGDKTDKENIKGSERTSEVKKNWFSSMFASSRKETLIKQGNSCKEDVKENIVEASKQEFKSSQSFGAQGLTISGYQQGGDDVVTSTQGLAVLGEVIAGEEQTLDYAVKEGTDSLYSSGVSQPAIIGTKVNILIEEASKADGNALSVSVKEALLLPEKPVNITKDTNEMPAKSSEGSDTFIVVKEEPVQPAATQDIQDTLTSAETRPSTLSVSEEAKEFHGVEIINSIVYGGLIESITSIGVVSSAAGADATTLNILALGLANLIGGLFFIGHNLLDLKNEDSVASNQVNEGTSNQATTQGDRYQQLLGRRENFLLHATIVILSFLIFGLLPPTIYGFSFYESDNKDYKLIAVSGASLVCIIILAAGKTYVQRPPKSYIKTILYYVIMGIMASGISYAAGDLIKKLLEKLGWFDTNLALSLPGLDMTTIKPARESY
ncbi:hypothetical protein NMG60_11020010 [Bertholletia excelsa]